MNTSRNTIRGAGHPREDYQTPHAAVIQNAFAGKFVEDLKALFEAGVMLGERLMPHLVKLLDGPAVSYGKGAIVGVVGEMEHCGAVRNRAEPVILSVG
jgi:Amino acid synthesis